MDKTVSISLPPVGEKRTDALLASYSEVCKSYHAVDDFRMKLLGLLPLASIGGIFLLNGEVLQLDRSETSRHLVAFAGAFAVVFTVALFVYEVRGILLCHDLTYQGHLIERELNVRGQFCLFVDRSRGGCAPFQKTGRIAGHLNAKLAACLVYSSVVAAWVFVVMRYGFGVRVQPCSIVAPAVGLALALGTYTYVRRLVSA